MSAVSGRLAISRIVYFGTPRVAVPPLRALHTSGFQVTLVVTQPPRRRTRRGAPIPTPVAAAASELGLPVAVDLHESAVSEAVGDADLGVVVAYGTLIGPELLEQLQIVNIHFSLLPRWRGAAPVQRAILAGDAETGVCLAEVTPGLDEGGVYRRVVTPIGPQETFPELQDRLCDLGVDVLVDAIAGGLGEPVAQSGSVTYAEKVEPAQMRIDWTHPAEDIHRLIRVGGAWTTFQGRRMKILEAEWRGADFGEGSGTGCGGTCGLVVRSDSDGVAVLTGDGQLELRVVQVAGGTAIAAGAWRNGARVGVGDRLGL